MRYRHGTFSRWAEGWSWYHLGVAYGIRVASSWRTTFAILTGKVLHEKHANVASTTSYYIRSVVVPKGGPTEILENSCKRQRKRAYRYPTERNKRRKRVSETARNSTESRRKMCINNTRLLRNQRDACGRPAQLCLTPQHSNVPDYK